MIKDSLVKAFKDINISINDEQVDKFIKYYDILIEWNKVMNLTAITNEDDVISKHFVDSIALVLFDKFNFVDKVDSSDITSVIDIGTGAGFPGIPLKIMFPSLKVTLLDSLNKRVKFLNHVIEELELNNIIAIHGRAEDIAKKEGYRENYDLCVSRAVSNLATLSEYCLPFVRVGKYFVLYKSQKLETEIDGAKKSISVMGGKLISKYKFNLHGTDDERTFAYIKKVKNTPKNYPRGGNKPAKEPIC